MAGRSFTVAIDGPAASGKGTIARALAARFDLAHLDTGLLYRAVGQQMLAQGGPIAPEAAAEVAATLDAARLDRAELRGAEVAEAASVVAAMPAVREALLTLQRRFARRAGGAVLDGRDIGTVICPEAEVKIFVTASLPVRAARRHAELQATGRAMALDAVSRDLAARDARDSARADAPLRQAGDALLLDTTELSIDAAVEEAAAAVSDKIPG
ncbi:MAG: (d)CMP kinase [Pseudomonadota bacterium]